MNAPPFEFAPRPLSPAPHIDVRLTPGAYMRGCRIEAGVSIRHCATLVARPPARDLAMRDIRALESDRPGDYLRLVTCLRDAGAFPFNFARFVALAAETCDPRVDPDAADPDFGAEWEE